MQNYTLILAAGGTSSRFGNTNKLLEKIYDKTVIEHTISRFASFKEINEIIIAANCGIIKNLESLFNDKRIKIVEGGVNRQQSVYNALQCVTNDYVLIHDAARPLVSREIISNVLNNVLKYNAVSVMTKTTDTIKEVDNEGRIIRTIDREHLYNTQTPQAFKTDILRKVHEKYKNQSYTDDASMLESSGIPVYIVIGSYENIKITTKCDLDFAKLYI